MKTLMLFAFITVSYTAFCQDYTVIKRITRKCSTIFNGESFGLLYNKQIVAPMEYSEYDIADGLIVFNKELASSCWNQNGELIIRFTDANMSLIEGNCYLLANRGENDQALYSRLGEVVVPFGQYEFEFYENGVLVKDHLGKQAFFNDYGREILPFDTKTITVIDESYDILAVTNEKTTRVLLSDELPLPYQCSKFSDYCFVLNHEVTIEEYLYFLGSQQNNGYLTSSDSDQIIPVSDFFPDTNKMEAKFRPLYRQLFPLLMNESSAMFEMKVHLPTDYYLKLYLPFSLDKTLKSLAKFPVTGITKEQAEAYCNWLNIICSEYNGYDTYDSYAAFRLPTVKEWETIAKDGLERDSRSKGMPDSLSTENCMLFVYNSSVPCKNSASYLKASKGGGTIPSVSVPIDEERRYQLFGNVAEMTNEDGIAKGGSYAHSAKDANLKNNTPYTSAEPWLGFRIVGEYHY